MKLPWVPADAARALSAVRAAIASPPIVVRGLRG